MQVMLIEDVVTLGRVGDIVEVKPGYGRNYLLPQGLAVLATKGALKQAETLRRSAEKRRARELENAQDFANQVGALRLRFERKVGEKGRLYGSVTSADVAEQIEQALELTDELDKRKVALEEPIKMLGVTTIPLHIHPDVPASVTVEVIGEDGERIEDYAVEEEVLPDEELLLDELEAAAPLDEDDALTEDEQPLADY